MSETIEQALIKHMDQIRVLTKQRDDLLEAGVVLWERRLQLEKIDTAVHLARAAIIKAEGETNERR